MPADKQLTDATLEQPKEKKPFFRIGKKKSTQEPEPTAEPPAAEPANEEKQRGILSMLGIHGTTPNEEPEAGYKGTEDEHADKPLSKPSSFFYFFGKQSAEIPAEAPATDATGQAEAEAVVPQKKTNRFALKLGRSKPEATAPPAAEEPELVEAPAVEPSFFGSIAKASASSVEYIAGAFSKPRSTEEAPAVEPEPEAQPITEGEDKELSRSCLPHSKPPASTADTGAAKPSGIASAA